ncbi:MAG: hypothetical protein A3J48_04575 [Candidatus Doudnabacteria bacterium RIFCSPHIGHO2_02_FULL_46_11]|uniref:Nudix hydrolase domain-containing protein n=1 Tax=Candidatus Doudnabacteria bacterium RIFCSPHIGHO2_02_FULL_46_11 TaxID=1817832 RepID=A0A1F5P6N0_9BACT|nr:MAG: hypothetical protein A3J48_04575 [Candidatus Doudnabacteria bacterium RIFCSPHIGHO2_02_FULL_46_11]
MRLIQCSKCNSDATEEIIYRGKKSYRCLVCGNIAPLKNAIDSRLKLSLDKHAKVYHLSIGFLLQNKAGKIFVGQKRTPPYEWNLIFGHVHSGETIEAAANREFMEGVGLPLGKHKLLFKTMAAHICPIGADKHLIHVFRVIVPVINNILPNREFKQIFWLEPQELKNKKFKRLSAGAKLILEKSDISGNAKKSK